MKNIPGYGGRYAVDESGRVYSHVSGKFLKPQKHNKGYRTVALTKRDGKGGKQVHLIHVLVAQAFIPNPEGLPTVNHDDGDKTNNAKGNLSWMTYSQNHKHAYDTLGRKPHLETLRDSSRRCGKVENGKTIAEYASVRDAAIANEVKERSVARVCRGERPHHKGFGWVYL